MAGKHSDQPETAPGRVRLLPPPPPPAPPGTGVPPPPSPPQPSWPGGEGPDEPFFRALDESLSEFAVIRTTFETKAVFPEDADLAQEMDGIITRARELLVRRLVQLQAHMSSLDGDLAAFRREMDRLATDGAGSRTLDSMMQTDVFGKPRHGGAKAPESYRFMRGEYAPDTWAALSDAEYGSRLIGVLLAAVEGASLQDPEGFDDAYRDFLVIVFAAFCSIDPFFRRRNAE